MNTILDLVLKVAAFLIALWAGIIVLGWMGAL
jgi:hypothetical protein